MDLLVRNPFGWMLALPIVGLVTVGCSSMPKSPDTVNRGPSATEVAPGGSGSCSFIPCSVFFRTPQANGPVTVQTNNLTVGTFPPDTLVRLGSFNNSTVRITVQGVDVPAAFVYMPTDNW
jgi:hypothetical protein